MNKNPNEREPDLKKLKQFYDRQGRMPSVRELARLLGFSSSNAASKLISRLSLRGAVDKDARGKLLPPKDWIGIPFIGLVEAGFPSPAQEELRDTISFDDYLIKNREATFLFQVKGDSMIGAGILPGDLVLVERGGEPKEGQIVIAEIDGEWTMKYFKRKRGQVLLEAANPRYRTLTPAKQLRIAAIVRAVVRRYSR